MRYTSSHPHALRNRIAKSIGVLVGAALVATLGLPSAVQAQVTVAGRCTLTQLTPDVIFTVTVPHAGPYTPLQDHRTCGLSSDDPGQRRSVVYKATSLLHQRPGGSGQTDHA